MVGYIASEDGRRLDFEDSSRIDVRFDSRQFWAMAHPSDGRAAASFSSHHKARAVEKAREYLGPDHALAERYLPGQCGPT